MDTVIKLVAESTSKNSYGAIVKSESSRTVFCQRKSVGRADFYGGMQAGLSLSHVFLTNKANYNGEEILEYEGDRYAIVRTYETDSDMMEIHAGRKVGVADGSNETG